MKKKELKHIKEELPNLKYDEKLKCFDYNDGSYMNIYRIVPRDLVNSDTDEIEMDCFQWAKFYKTYGLDIEIVSMLFPCDTGAQQRYWKKILKGNKNPFFEPMLQQKINELQYREKYASQKEFFMLYFFPSREEIEDAVKTLDSTLEIRRVNGFGKMGMLEELTEKKKRQILFKMGNKNSMIF